MSDIFKDLSLDDLFTVEHEGNTQTTRVATPVSINARGNGDITIEMNIPCKGTYERGQELTNGGLCEHEERMLEDGLKEIVRKIVDHRLGNDDGSNPVKVDAVPLYAANKPANADVKRDVQALIKKGIALSKGKDNYDA